MNLRRLSKMVLGGYGGASLIFFGLPYPGQQPPTKSKKETSSSKGKEPARSEDPPDMNIVQEEEEVLAQLVHDADEEEITAGSSALPPTSTVSSHSRYHSQDPSTSTNAHNPTPTPTNYRTNAYPNSIGRAGSIPFPSVSTASLGSTAVHPASVHSPTDSTSTETGDSPAAPAPPIPSWWDILTGKRDQEIFEGFASAAIAAGEIKEGAKEARKEMQRGWS